MRVFGCFNEQIFEAFKDIDTPDTKYIQNTLDKDASTNADEGFKEVYKESARDLATVDNAKSLISECFSILNAMIFPMSAAINLTSACMWKQQRSALTLEDLTKVVREVIRLNNTQEPADDIDHLANRRVRAIGELIQTRFRVGLARMARIAKDRMSLADLETVTPAQLIHVRPVVATMQEFFSSSQLSQFMDQTNPLAELEHKRRLSAMGPGGLSRERAGFEVRDVHRSHYGRLCPITTPEGPNIGLVAHLATYAKVNDFGFIETPYRLVKKNAKNDNKDSINEVSLYDIKDVKGRLIVSAGSTITATKPKN